MRQLEWECIGIPERQIRGTAAQIVIKKMEIVVLGQGKAHINLEFGRADIRKDIYQLGYFSYHFQPALSDLRAFRVDNDERNGLHANDDKGAHFSTADGLELEKVNIATFLGLVAEYVHTGQYPFDRNQFSYSNGVLTRYLGRVVQ